MLDSCTLQEVAKVSDFPTLKNIKENFKRFCKNIQNQQYYRNKLHILLLRKIFIA